MSCLSVRGPRGTSLESEAVPSASGTASGELKLKGLGVGMREKGILSVFSK